MSSLWQLTSPVIECDDFDGRSCDAVVVGAGLTGIVTAVLLARAGQSVTLLEARHVGAVTTGNTTGKVSLLQGTVFSGIRERAGSEVLAAYADANREGQSWLLRELEGRGEHVERQTAYTYAIDEDQLESLRVEREAALEAGIQLDETLETGLPFEIAGALRLKSQAQVHPLAVLAHFADELRERGGKVVQRCRVLDVEEQGQGLEIITAQGKIASNICVLATGTPILDRGMFFAKATASRSFVAAYRLKNEPVPEGMYVSLGGTARSLRSAKGADGSELLIVGGGAVRPRGGADTREALSDLDRWVAEHFRDPHRLIWWAAQDYRTHSLVPFAGELPRGGGKIFTATGYNKWGMTNAVASALAITSAVLGGHMEWASVLREHCLGFTAAGEALRSNAVTAGRLISDWTLTELRALDKVADPAEGEGIVARDGVEPVAVSRVNGLLCRVSGVCTHLGGILNWNAAEQSWDCPLHGSRFAANGTLLEGPAVHDLTPAPGPSLREED